MASFYAHFDRIAPSANKYMATLFNTNATRCIIVRRIYAYPAQAAATTGVLLEQYLAFITARTAGTSVPIRPHDSTYAISTGMTADTNSTAVTERDIIKRFFRFGEEHPVIGTTAPSINVLQFHDPDLQLVWERQGRGITLKTNEGIAIRNVTSSTAGSVSYLLEFSDEVE